MTAACVAGLALQRRRSQQNFKVQAYLSASFSPLVSGSHPRMGPLFMQAVHCSLVLLRGPPQSSCHLCFRQVLALGSLLLRKPISAGEVLGTILGVAGACVLAFGPKAADANITGNLVMLDAVLSCQQIVSARRKSCMALNRHARIAR